jgi:hypothetical protein
VRLDFDQLSRPPPLTADSRAELLGGRSDGASSFTAASERTGGEVHDRGRATLRRQARVFRVHPFR